MSAIYEKREKLFGLISFVQLPEVQVVPDFIIGMLSDRDDRLIPSCIEVLKVVDTD